MSENELRKWQSKTIKTDETPSWNKESFLREPYSKDDFSLLADKNIEGGFVKPHNWIDQHDILVHVATTFDLGGHRCENLSLEQIASEMNYLNHEGRKVMIITSVSVNYRWPDSERVGGHLIVVNGFRTNSEGEVTEVCITDSSNFASRGNRENNWFQIDQHARDSFKGRAIFLYTK